MACGGPAELWNLWSILPIPVLMVQVRACLFLLMCDLDIFTPLLSHTNFPDPSAWESAWPQMLERSCPSQDHQRKLTEESEHLLSPDPWSLASCPVAQR